jgi:hypothetical protein
MCVINRESKDSLISEAKSFDLSNRPRREALDKSRKLISQFIHPGNDITKKNQINVTVHYDPSVIHSNKLCKEIYTETMKLLFKRMLFSQDVAGVNVVILP